MESISVVLYSGTPTRWFIRHRARYRQQPAAARPGGHFTDVTNYDLAAAFDRARP